MQQSERGSRYFAKDFPVRPTQKIVKNNVTANIFESTSFIPMVTTCFCNHQVGTTPRR
jgi:hypothetical protein